MRSRAARPQAAAHGRPIARPRLDARAARHRRAFAAERSAIDARLKWDLSELYPSEAAWTKAKDDLTARIGGIAAFQGHLGDSPQKFYEALAMRMDMDRDLSRLATYASQTADEDTRNSQHDEMQQAAGQLFVQFGSAASYMRPEILALGSTKVRAMMAAEPRLKPYTPYIEDILRYEPHTLTAAEEKISAQAGRMARAGGAPRSSSR